MNTLQANGERFLHEDYYRNSDIQSDYYFHELGHFLLAKANGIRVNEFCLGLGPKVFGITKGETTYSLHLFPIGGACMMEGEDTESEDGRAFGKKSVWARISVVIAGPVFNFLMAFVFAFILLCNIG